MSHSSGLKLNDVGAKECPKWIATKLGLPVEDVSSLEITSTSEIYGVLLKYLQIVAVDATKAPPKCIDTSADEPESPGRLSTLLTDMRDANILINRKRKVAVKSVRGLGLGYVRLIENENDVFVAHIARGKPIPAPFPTLFRQLLLFAASPKTLEKVLTNAVEWKHQLDEKKRMPKKNKYILYTLQVLFHHVSWHNHGQKDARPLNSIFLADGLQNSIFEDIQNFMEPSTKEWYINHGLPYRRTYLFHGPPGVGKTSLIRGIAGELKLTACFLSLIGIGDEQLQTALDLVPEKSVVILEDVDVLFNKERKSQTISEVSFSGLLNVLDGLVSAESMLTIMTTNHIDRLDAALIRAGRVDRRFEFRAPERKQIECLFKSYYTDSKSELSEQFVDAVFRRPEKDARSLATLQQHFIYTRGKSAQESLELLEDFFKEFYPHSDGSLSESIYN